MGTESSWLRKTCLVSRLFGGASAVLGLLNGCSLQPTASSVTLVLDVPKSSAAQVQSRNSKGSAGLQENEIFEVPGANEIWHDWLSLDGPRALNSPPSTVDGFDCYGVNVYAPDLSSTSNGGSNCAYKGVTSSLATSGNNVITMTVPAGPARKIQMIGVQNQLAPGGGCGSAKNLSDFINLTNNPPTNGTGPSGSTGNTGTGGSPYPQGFQLNLLGSTQADLFQSTTVTISNSYNPSSPVAPFQCSNGGPGQGVNVPLAAIAYGSVSIPSFGGGDVPSVWPPTTTNGFLVSSFNANAGDTQLLGNPNNTTPLMYVASGGEYERVDMVFDLAQVPNFMQYSNVTVNFSATSGTFGVTGNLETQGSPLVSTIANPYFVKAWSPSQGWSYSQNGPLNSMVPVPGSFSTQAAGGGSPSFGLTGAATMLLSVPGGIGPYIYVSFRSQDISNYSAMLIQYVQVLLY